MPKRKSFTLMEMILVIVIIAMLATLVLTQIAGRGKEARIGVAKSQISSLKTALNAFELDCGRFPSAAEGLTALVEKPAGLPESAKWRQYLDESRVPLDPWDRSFIYRYPGTVNEGGYDLLSAGPDGKEGTDDDIGNIGR